MTPPQKQPDLQTKTAKAHEPGALAAWGMILGLVLGVVIGLIVGSPLIAGLIASTLGWFAGALIERSRL